MAADAVWCVQAALCECPERQTAAAEVAHVVAMVCQVACIVVAAIPVTGIAVLWFRHTAAAGQLPALLACLLAL